MFSPTMILNIQELTHRQEQHRDNSSVNSVTSNDFVQTQNQITCENGAVFGKSWCIKHFFFSDVKSIVTNTPTKTCYRRIRVLQTVSGTDPEKTGLKKKTEDLL